MGIEVKAKSCPKIETKVKFGNWRSGATKLNLSAFLLRPDHCGCYNFDDPPFHLLPPTATGTGTQICLADRMRYNDNADDARNELQLLRLECATILVEQSSLDWLHLSGQWDLCRRVGKVDSVVVWLRSAWSCGSFTVFKFVSICAIISWLRFAYATSTSNKLPPGQL